MVTRRASVDLAAAGFADDGERLASSSEKLSPFSALTVDGLRKRRRPRVIKALEIGSL